MRFLHYYLEMAKYLAYFLPHPVQPPEYQPLLHRRQSRPFEPPLMSLLHLHHRLR